MQKIVVSVSKTYTHRGRRFRHRPTTKKRWHVYYYQFDPADGKFKLKTRRVNWLQALYYKGQRKHRFKYYCNECNSAAMALIKSRKSSLKCPICGNG